MMEKAVWDLPKAPKVPRDIQVKAPVMMGKARNTIRSQPRNPCKNQSRNHSKKKFPTTLETRELNSKCCNESGNTDNARSTDTLLLYHYSLFLTAVKKDCL
mmetsp:Transcript_31548/g.57120  ORF Transcript_31548/g.57120 Transcript_31548/m.57120 type:complete len:101 (-) Transcript_31548:300-602(-)